METRAEKTRLESLIRAQIAASGPMDIGHFMQMANAHYYATRDPLGAAGDFTTAPEISQLFGEMIGLALADTWMRSGRPHGHLVELGPGRGTLMSDILRATKHVPGFYDAVSIELVETSPTLSARQKETLKEYPHVVWHEDISTLPDDQPLMIVANEFFDALPIRQAVATLKGWQERVIGLDENDALTFGLAALPPLLKPREHEGVSAVIEFSPARDEVFHLLCTRLQNQGGMMLVIDYGHEEADATGDTLQAVYRHAFCPVLTHIGEADLTSHVDFARMKVLAAEAGAQTSGSVTQGDFLKALGIATRLEQLEAKNQKADLRAGVERLIDDRQMGRLFRVLAVTGDRFSLPPGL